ncbi:MAG: amidohydrolase family protein, partial [Candidatus Eisenbacteria bacterium]|nr:amidohydrolase family protein [Candidatus Eisenbacteria bacterium]
GNVFKVAEVRALCAGTTMMQGRNCNVESDDFYGQQGMVINNAERFPSRIYTKTFPLDEDMNYWQDMKEEYWDRFVIHLSEGINAAALQEFYTWRQWGMLDWRTTILHGIPYGPTEWQLMAEAEANLVWSPKSDMFLYAASPDIPGALLAGVNVAIAPDWTESGTRDMLQEIQYGNKLNTLFWGSTIEPVDFALFATRNAAYAMGAEDRIGQVATGYQADLMVIPGDPEDPYQALLEIDAADVKLTVVSGRPMYGDPDLMDEFLFLDNEEDISVCGLPKKLAIQIEAYSISESDKPMSTVMDELQVAYDNTTPKVCDFLGPFDCPTSDIRNVSVDPVLGLHVGPNPMHTGTAYSFALPHSSVVSLKVYNVNGRIVRTLVEQQLNRGSHNIIWDGRDDNDRPVAGGALSGPA